MLTHTRSKKPLGRGCRLCFYGESLESREQMAASLGLVSGENIKESLMRFVFFPGVGRGMELFRK